MSLKLRKRHYFQHILIQTGTSIWTLINVGIIKNLLAHIYDVVKEVLAETAYIFATLGHDLLEAESTNIEVKTLLNLKADHERYTAYLIADALLIVITGLNFRWRWEKIQISAEKLMALITGRGEEQLFNNSTVNGDRVSGKECLTVRLFGTWHETKQYGSSASSSSPS